MSLSRDHLAEVFRTAGLCEGDSVMVHSAFRTLKPFDGTPEDVVRAICDVIGDRGNVMLPTFHYTAPLPEPYYELAATPALTGAVAERGRNLPGMVRSLHPTHSVAVFGPDAGALTRDHLKTRAFGVGSPIDRLADLGGKVLLIGVGFVSNSTVHVAEERAELPKPPKGDPPPRARVRLPDGSIIEHEIDPSPSCSAGFESAAYLLRIRGLVRDVRANNCLIQSMSGRDVIEQVAAALRENPTLLLCTNPHCRSCTLMRKNLIS
jgi:aminoglycoside 3-N-acetyltransferase